MANDPQKQQQLPPGLTPLDSPGVSSGPAQSTGLPPGLTPLETSQPDFSKRPGWWDKIKNWASDDTVASGTRDPKTGMLVTPGPSTSDLRQQAAGTEQQRQASIAAGNPDPGGASWERTVADVRDVGAGLFTPKNALLGLAMTNPVTGIPASAYMIGEGAKTVGENLPEALEGKPDPLQRTLMGGAETIGGAAGFGQGVSTAKTNLQNWAMENPDVAALKAQGVDPNSSKASRALTDAQMVRRYAGAPKTQAELQNVVKQGGPARTEIWDNYNKAIQQVGNRVVQGPDGPTTVEALEQERLKLSAQNRAIKAKDPNAYQEIVQAGRTPAENIAREQAVISVLDPELASTGLDPKLTRQVMGNVMGVSKRVSGRMGGLETAPSGLGRLAGTARVNVGSSGPQIYVPENIRGAIVEGTKDIVAGRGVFRQRPADVAVKEGFRNPGAKPNLTPGPPALPVPTAAAPAPPQPPPGPVSQVGAPPPMGFPAQLPNTLWDPTQQGTTWNLPGRSVSSTEVPGVQPTSVELPDTLTTPGRPSVPQGQRGLTDAQMRGMPSFMRDRMSDPVPRPGEYSTPDVGPDRSPLPQPEADEGGSATSVAPPTDLTVTPESQPNDQVLPEQIQPDFVDKSVHPWESEARVQSKQADLQQGDTATIVARSNPDGTYSPVKGHNSPVAAAREGQPVNVVDAGPMTDGEKAAATAESHFFPQDDHAVPASLAKDAASERASLPDEIKTAPAMPAKEGPQSDVLQRGNQLPERLGPERRGSIRDITGPDNMRTALMNGLRERAAQGDTLAQQQLQDMINNPFERAGEESNVVTAKAKNQPTMTREQAEAASAKRTEGRNKRFQK